MWYVLLRIVLPWMDINRKSGSIPDLCSRLGLLDHLEKKPLHSEKLYCIHPLFLMALSVYIFCGSRIVYVSNILINRRINNGRLLLFSTHLEPRLFQAPNIMTKSTKRKWRTHAFLNQDRDSSSGDAEFLFRIDCLSVWRGIVSSISPRSVFVIGIMWDL